MLFQNKDGKAIETDNKNLFSMLEREGFKKVEETENSLLKIAKELGIKSAHLMSEETLKQKIADKQP